MNSYRKNTGSRNKIIQSIKIILCTILMNSMRKNTGTCNKIIQSIKIFYVQT